MCSVSGLEKESVLDNKCATYINHIRIRTDYQFLFLISLLAKTVCFLEWIDFGKGINNILRES